jgi:hypothetical protein
MAWRRQVKDVPGKPTSLPQVVGRTVTLMLVPTGSTVPFGPVWAALCGAWASGSWRWEGHVLLALVMALFIAEALWSTWRAQLIDMDWANYVAAHPLPPPGGPASGLPYTTPWSPLGRLHSRWAQVRRWMVETLPIERRGALLALPALPPLILLLSALVGWQMLVLSVAALSLALIEWLIARRGRAHIAPRAALEIGLSWLAGHAALGQLSWESFTLACCYSLAYQGILSLSAAPEDRMSEQRQGHAARPWSLALFYGGQVAATIALLLRERRALWAATAMGVLLAPQLLLLSGFEIDERGAWYVRRAAPFAMLAMAIAAWAV